MPTYSLNIRRFSPESGLPAHWQKFEVEMEGHRPVLDAILRARAKQDGSIGIRCSCQAAICGSCGIRINGNPALACNTLLRDAVATSEDGVTIDIEPMGNMPVLKDLIVDMDAVHWKKVQRVVPWLIPEGDPPEREYIVPHESMVDVTQSMACIHCGVCVSDCLTMEVDAEFVGPAASAKAYRFVGDPRDGATEQRLEDLANDPHGIYDCTHCFKCVEVCPKDVAPMNQIMRLRRRATSDFKIKDVNNGYRHEKAFVDIIQKWGTLHEAKLLPDSYGEGILGKANPEAQKNLIASLPTALRGLKSGKVTLPKVLHHHKLPDQPQIKRIFEEVEGRGERIELNLYIVGEDADEDSPAVKTPAVVGAESSGITGDDATTEGAEG
ncbi:MAG TPA: 2Fe-2S iron-sulfur cluster-binding protein [Solirubrobacterales bacterium]|jgi:succinate dehydrogenase / fumarate reductase iron-sulfur subunit|nr:2Fe-2S iron-sulfur cluster-binding protein [Solirubrobacterales bacterium]